MQDNDKQNRDDLPGDAASEIGGAWPATSPAGATSPGPIPGRRTGSPSGPIAGWPTGRGDVTARGSGDNPSQAVPTERVADLTVPEGDSIPGQGDTMQQASAGIDSSSDIRSAADMTGPDGGAMKLPARDTSATDDGG